MKKIIVKPTNGLYKNNSYEAQSLMQKIRAKLMNKEPIEGDGDVPMTYTERKDGVLPEYDIRTDRFELAQRAMEKMHSAENSEIAKTNEIPGTNGQEEPKPGTVE